MEPSEYSDLEREIGDRVADAQPEHTTPGVAARLHWVWATIGSFLAVLVLLTLTGRIDTLARTFLRGFAADQVMLEDRTPPPPVATRNAGMFTFQELDLHPDLLFSPYTSGSVVGDSTSPTARVISGFRELLSLYQQRQGVDDNFTIRAVDNRSGELLELYVLEDHKARYEETRKADWDEIDRVRRQHTRRLVDKHAARGIPRQAVTVKWGRANQVREARERDVPYISYEVRLARALGLSLLATEIGTVETFNQDWLVSSVGARSRYQMMPSLLRREGIRHYSLQAAGGNKISVFEEWHPLLTMEPAMVFLKGYVNAVGHEIPGISAYHAGPANIFNIYRKYLTEARELITPNASVMDAYAWGVTTGFDSVTKGSSFGQHSRGYVASNYGALRATDSIAVDTSMTMLAELVQVRPGRHVFLSQVLAVLDDAEDQLHWPRQVRGESYYDRFRYMNPHIVLPAAPDSLGIPVTSDVRFVSMVDGARVRFFLPLGASRLLREAGVTALNDNEIRRFDHRTYVAREHGEKTMFDRAYDELVADIARFGFTRSNRVQLYELADRFSEMARTTPSRYRQMQNDIIQTHKGVWQWSQWESLAITVAAVEGELRPTTRPPTTLGVPLPNEIRAGR